MVDEHKDIIRNLDRTLSKVERVRDKSYQRPFRDTVERYKESIKRFFNKDYEKVKIGSEKIIEIINVQKPKQVIFLGRDAYILYFTIRELTRNTPLESRLLYMDFPRTVYENLVLDTDSKDKLLTIMRNHNVNPEDLHQTMVIDTGLRGSAARALSSIIPQIGSELKHKNILYEYIYPVLPHRDIKGVYEARNAEGLYAINPARSSSIENIPKRYAKPDLDSVVKGRVERSKYYTYSRGPSYPEGILSNLFYAVLRRKIRDEM